MAMVKKIRIRDRRNELGLTQAQVAEMLGISNSLYSMLETGVRRMNETYLNGLAKILKTKPSALLEEEDGQVALFIDEFLQLTESSDREQALDHIRFLRARREALKPK